MILGALLMAAALLLTAWNLLQDYSADQSAQAVLTALTAAMPEQEQEEPTALRITDADGNPVDWPMDETGAPMPWTLDASGSPVSVMTDASGRSIAWPTDAGGQPLSVRSRRWTVLAEGLLPWASDDDGMTIQWPVNADGRPSTLSLLQILWRRLAAQMKDSMVQPEPDFVLNPNMAMPTMRIDGRDYIGTLEIPSLELSLPVMSDWSYPKLRTSPCRYTGSAYSGDLIVAGHNYSRHFGRLRQLEAGDEVRFTDVEGNVFLYQVSAVETLGKYAVDEMKSGGWDLTLFTCTYGGASRVTVRCACTGVLPAAA